MICYLFFFITRTAKPTPADIAPPAMVTTAHVGVPVVFSSVSSPGNFSDTGSTSVVVDVSGASVVSGALVVSGSEEKLRQVQQFAVQNPHSGQKVTPELPQMKHFSLGSEGSNTVTGIKLVYALPPFAVVTIQQ